MENPDFTRRREGVIVRGALGPLLVIELLTVEECQEVWEGGGHVPLDLVPNEYWSPADLPFPRFGEEMLGAEF